MNKKFMLIAGTVALTAVALTATGVMAADPSPTPTSTTAVVQEDGEFYGKGFGGGFGGGMVANEAVTKLLGMTAEQIQDARQAGKSLVQIATEKGVTEAALVNAIYTVRQAQIEEQVSAGKLTREQADAALTQIQARVTAAVNRTVTGPNEDRGESGLALGKDNGAGNQQGMAANGSGRGNMNRGGAGAQGKMTRNCTVS